MTEMSSITVRSASMKLAGIRTMYVIAAENALPNGMRFEDPSVEPSGTWISATSGSGLWNTRSLGTVDWEKVDVAW